MSRNGFKNWFENNENAWNRLYRLLIQSIQTSPFKDIRMHRWIVDALKEVGLTEEADELEMLRPTRKDLEVANRPMEIGPTFGHILQHQKRDKDLESFRMTFHQYKNALERLTDQVWDYGKNEFGWKD